MGNIIRQGDLLRSLQVVKMRGTKHSRARHLIELTPVGLAVVPLLKWGQDGGQDGGDGVMDHCQIDGASGGDGKGG